VGGWTDALGRRAARSHARPLTVADPPTHASFITALDDAYLMPRDGAYTVFWRTSGRDLCAVPPDVAADALRRDGQAVRLGSWSGTLRGRGDEWALWWAGGLVWAATGDVAESEQALRLIERWRAQAAREEACGRRWDPLPPGVPTSPQTPPARPAPRRRARALLALRLRALFRTP
jgi:hypothetical protein